MHEIGAAQAVIGTFAAQIAARDAAKIGIDQGDELIRRFGIAAAPFLKERGNVGFNHFDGMIIGLEERFPLLLRRGGRRPGWSGVTAPFKMHFETFSAPDHPVCASGTDTPPQEEGKRFTLFKMTGSVV